MRLMVKAHEHVTAPADAATYKDSRGHEWTAKAIRIDAVAEVDGGRIVWAEPQASVRFERSTDVRRKAFALDLALWHGGGETYAERSAWVQAALRRFVDELPATIP